VNVTEPEGVTELPVTVAVSVAVVPLTEGLVDRLTEHDETVKSELTAL
jgi:hypothetical protein